MKTVSLYPEVPMFDQLPYFGLTDTILSQSRDLCVEGINDYTLIQIQLEMYQTL